MDITDAVKISYEIEDLVRRILAKNEHLSEFVGSVTILEAIYGGKNQRVQAMYSAGQTSETIAHDLGRLNASVQVRTTQLERAQGPGLAPSPDGS
jgi:hypothetical protein